MDLNAADPESLGKQAYVAAIKAVISDPSNFLIVDEKNQVSAFGINPQLVGLV